MEGLVRAKPFRTFRPVVDAGNAHRVIAQQHALERPKAVLVGVGPRGAQAAKQLGSPEDQPCRLALDVLDDSAVVGLRRIARDLCPAQQRGTQDRGVAVVQHRFAPGRGGIDFEAVWIAMLLEAGGIDLRNENQTLGREFLRLLAHICLDFRNRMEQRNRPIDLAQSGADRVDMGFDDPRYDALPSEVDFEGAGSCGLQHFVVRAGGNETVAANGNGLRGGPVGREGDDMSVVIDRVRSLRPCRGKACCEEPTRKTPTDCTHQITLSRRAPRPLGRFRIWRWD